MEINEKQQTAEDILAMALGESDKIEKLTRKGTGVGTAFRWRETPFVLVAADSGDLQSLLTLMCGIEESQIDAGKFRAVKVSFDK